MPRPLRFASVVFLRAILVTALFLVGVGCSRSSIELQEQTQGVGGRGGNGGGGGAGSCDASNCSDGCCAPSGMCVPGTSDDACGSQGEACINCALEPASVCQPDTRECVGACAGGNLVCEPECGEDGEDGAFCIPDCYCPTACGNFACDLECGEGPDTCPQDCTSCACGDLFCQPECGEDTF